jgi:hypothetical protein
MSVAFVFTLNDECDIEFFRDQAREVFNYNDEIKNFQIERIEKKYHTEFKVSFQLNTENINDTYEDAHIIAEGMVDFNRDKKQVAFIVENSFQYTPFENVIKK